MTNFSIIIFLTLLVSSSCQFSGNHDVDLNLENSCYLSNTELELTRQSGFDEYFKSLLHLDSVLISEGLIYTRNYEEYNTLVQKALANRSVGRGLELSSESQQHLFTKDVFGWPYLLAAFEKMAQEKPCEVEPEWYTRLDKSLSRMIQTNDVQAEIEVMISSLRKGDSELKSVLSKYLILHLTWSTLYRNWGE